MKAIDFNKIGMITIAALALSACENSLTGPDAQDLEDADVSTYEAFGPYPIQQQPLLPPPPPPVLIFENGNETLCVPSGRSHQLTWQVYDRYGKVNVNLRSRVPGTTAYTSEYTVPRSNTVYSTGEGGGNFSPVIGQDENGLIHMDPLREYQYTVTPASYTLYTWPTPEPSRSGWFRVSYSAFGGQLLCY